MNHLALFKFCENHRWRLLLVEAVSTKVCINAVIVWYCIGVLQYEYGLVSDEYT